MKARKGHKKGAGHLESKQMWGEGGSRIKTAEAKEGETAKGGKKAIRSLPELGRVIFTCKGAAMDGKKKRCWLLRKQTGSADGRGARSGLKS